MLRKPTLFILGAGTGFDFRMPLGKDLASAIATKTDIRFKSGYEQRSGDPIVMEALRKVARINGGDVNEYLQAGRIIKDGIEFTRSIDSFLHKHENEEKIQTVAKIAIVQIIAESEKNGSLFVDTTKSSLAFRENDKVMASWLEDFFFIIQEHVSRAQLDSLLRNLMIVNFNYDRCIEHFLMCAIRRVYQKDEHSVAELLNKHLKIIHPYGTIGDLPWQSPNGISFGDYAYREPQNLITMASGIRTFNEELKENSAIWHMRGMIEHAELIIFLGFHFHEPNMELLKIERHSKKPQVYATAFERSENAVESIRAAIVNSVVTSNDIIRVDRKLDCKGFFREYTDVLSA